MEPFPGRSLSEITYFFRRRVGRHESQAVRADLNDGEKRTLGSAIPFVLMARMS
jgi:hypothetical protein